MRLEERIGCRAVGREQTVTDADFTCRLGQLDGGWIAEALYRTGTDVDGLVSEYFVGIGIYIGATRFVNIEQGDVVAFNPAYVNTVTGAGNDVFIGTLHDIGRALECVLVDNQCACQECVNGIKRNSRDSIFQALFTDARRQFAITAHADAWFAIDVSKVQHITRVDQVRVTNLWIHVPYFGP